MDAGDTAQYIIGRFGLNAFDLFAIDNNHRASLPGNGCLFRADYFHCRQPEGVLGLGACAKWEQGDCHRQRNTLGLK